MTTPFSLLVKPVGAACNLACDYCFYLDKAALYPDGPAVMPREVMEQMVSSYLALPFDSHSIAFQGGEPLLAGIDFFKDVADAVRRHSRPNAKVHLSIQTNATLMTRQMAEFLAGEGWLAGVSIDGPAELHDRHRRSAAGEGSHADVMRVIDLLRRAGAEFNVLCLATSDSLECPGTIYRYLRDEIGARWHQYSQRLGDITTEQWDGFLCGILDAWASDGDAGRVFVRNIEDTLAYVRTGIATQCIFGERCDGHVVVERNGDVYPCDFFVAEGTRLGNIMETGWQALRSSPNARVRAAGKCPRHLSKIGSMRFYERCAAAVTQERDPPVRGHAGA